MMRWLSIVTFALLLSGCSAQWHLRKAVKKDPFILKKDTLVMVDTVVTPPVELKDTVVLKKVDTLTVFKERLKVKVFRSFDTIRVDAICDADTIISIVEVPVEKIIYKEKKDPMDALISLGIVLALALIGWKLIEASFFKR